MTASPSLDAAPSLAVLGRVDLRAPRGPEPSPLLSQPKRLAVLVYLLLERRDTATTRDQLTATFWPESDEDRARNSLRQTLSVLRSSIGSECIHSVGTHGVMVDPSVRCDAVEFESLLDAERLHAAMQLYRGDLLPAFHVPGSYAFNEWLDTRRLALRDRAAQAAWALASGYEDVGDLAEASFWGKRALGLSPFSELHVQRLMRLLERTGDVAGALRAYHGLEQSMMAEFDASPSAETRSLAAQIALRVKASGGSTSAFLGTRRSGVDRRTADAPFSGPERRVRDRRSGVDRRSIRELPPGLQS